MESARDLDAAVNSFNGQLARVNRRIDLYVVEGTGQLAAKVVDTESNEIVKYIPPKELLELRSRFDDLRGLFVSTES